MTDGTWRPLGVDEDERTLAEYDALHDGVPAWMAEAYWAWVQVSLTAVARSSFSGSPVKVLNSALAESMCQALRIVLPNLRTDYFDYSTEDYQFKKAMPALRAHSQPLQIADFLLAAGGNVDKVALDKLLERSNSAWTVGVRNGFDGLQRRVPLGVQVAVDSVMSRTGQAGTRLAQAWEQLYGMGGSASEAYRLAIQAVEDAAVPVVSPTNPRATLGTVIAQIESQGDWKLPMQRETSKGSSGAVLISLMRLLWHGQHDRHGGQPSAPGAVSPGEANVAVSAAVLLVSWFTDGSARRTTN